MHFKFEKLKSFATLHETIRHVDMWQNYKILTCRNGVLARKCTHL